MPNSQNGPLLPIERPHCSKCQNRMKLTRIMPGPKGYDLRNFECVKCDNFFITATVAADRVRADKIGWLAGDLKPPE
jgi:hypothetical protein